MDAPPVIASVKPRRPTLWLTVALPMAVCAAVLFFFNPSQYTFYPRCTLYVTTGIYCPGCGSLRAMHYLSHGHLLTALHYNPLLILSLPLVVYILAPRILDWAAGRPITPFLVKPKWVWAAIIVVVLFTILRNIPVAPFTYLAPP